MDKESKMFSLIREWESSDLDRLTFCKEHDIKVSKFSYWRTKYKHSQSADTQAEGFVKVNPKTCSSIELLYPNGVKAILPPEIDHVTLSTLIHLV